MTSFRDHPIEEWMSRKETKSLVAKLRASASPWAHHSQIFAYLEVPHARHEARRFQLHVLSRIMAHSSSLASFQDFAEAHALPSKIQFNTRVLKVPISSESEHGEI
jgi:hypothetical protein